MTYEQAIARAKDGHRVKRHDWSNQYIQARTNTDEIEVVYVRTTKALYTSTQDDMIQDDWENVT